MSTVYDWLTVALFAGLIVLFLQRSVGPGPPRDSMWQYLVAAVGCAVVNWLGNADYHLPAILLFAALLGYIWVVLKPLAPPEQ